MYFVTRSVAAARPVLSNVTGIRIPVQRTACRTFTRTCECADARRSVKSRDPQGNSDPNSVNALRKTILEEVAIPGKYRIFFNPDKRTLRKSENKLGVDRSRSPKKIAATKWRNAQEEYQDINDLATTAEESTEQSAITGAKSRGSLSKKTGFENVASRALEQVYARDVLPHPYFHRDYFEVTEIKLLQDRKTFQLWYRPKPTGRVTADEITDAVSTHAAAFKAMLARHARTSTSSRLIFQLKRQSDLQADMNNLWTALEKQVQEDDERLETVSEESTGKINEVRRR
ncbi:hypothetical protein EMPS_00516 [Entomortierella parvispora]|uniref:Uncharacterized protein n=1 Tax=Entomortierella parvispora TaxID=205924 RepID=A0A9P3LS20_9FUNG|nr:hypothetical protein EMPS_00516 [Entomortierella parvispora]